ncbi:MAG: hypothetical protein E6J91_08105 [Deltaproteobacteria bacterium]|nr:MAG: hypothetical protein E6J91_08105 [Deltaproteobacteria bacterium]
MPPKQAGLIDFTAERQRHVRFGRGDTPEWRTSWLVGRDDVLAQIDSWLEGPRDTRWVVVIGGPGMGKSAILAAWLARREAKAGKVPHHLIRSQVADWDQPEVIAESLAAQIEVAFPECRDAAAKPERRMIELLSQVSKQLGTTGRLVVVVDGLDETRAEPGENPLPRFLPHVVPLGICFLCATRPAYPHLGWLEARGARRLNLDDARWAASNDAVVRGFWQAAASEYEPPLSAETRDAAIARAEGNVLHAVMVHEHMRDLRADQRRADRIPRGLRELIGEVWKRAASDKAVREGLGLLCAARDALSLDVLARLAGWRYEEKERFVRDALALLLEEPASWAGTIAYRPRHDWVRELIAEWLGPEVLRAHHATLAEGLATWPTPSAGAERQYALRHALIHRVEADEWADAWRLAADMSFLEAKCREIGVYETEIDLTSAAERCRSHDAVVATRFGDLARALGRESHWLYSIFPSGWQAGQPAVSPHALEATMALVWNRLRRSGWSAEDLGAQLRIPSGAAFLCVRQVVSRESAALVRNLVGHSHWVHTCAVMPDGRRAVSASQDQTLRLWDLVTGRMLAIFEGHSERVTACAVTHDGRRLLSASLDRTLKLWDLATGVVLATFVGHTSWVNACAMTPDGRRVVSASLDGTLRLWDGTGQTLATLEGHTDSVTACAVTPDGQQAVSASFDRTLKLWDLVARRVRATLEGHTDWVNACVMTPDGQQVVSASHDRTLRLWDFATGRVGRIFEGHTEPVTACAVTPDGHGMVSASDDRTLKLWDLSTGGVLATLEGHANWVNACAVTPDSRRVVSASNDQTVKVWDFTAGRIRASFEGHTDWVTACVVTPDGQAMVSTSRDEKIKLWDLTTCRVRATLAGHTASVTACAVTPDGQHAVSASLDRWSPHRSTGRSRSGTSIPVAHWPPSKATAAG